MIRWIVIAACLVAIVVPFGDSDEAPPPPKTTDVFDEFACSYRALLAETWEEFSATDFESDDVALDWINQRNKLAHQAAFEPVHTRAASATDQGPEFISQFAADLRGGTLR